jgi:uncharacterized protein YtpQ (UPF0354 family)
VSDQVFGLFKKKSSPREAPVSTDVAVFARIKNSAFRPAVAATVLDAGEEFLPLTENLVGDLVISYAIDEGSGYVFLSPHKFRELGLNPSTTRAHAIANTMMKLADISVLERDCVFQLHNPDGFAACSVLFPKLWAQLMETYGGPLSALFLDRDVVLFGRSDSLDAMRRLEEERAAYDFGQTHALSQLVYHFQDGGWVASGA